MEKKPIIFLVLFVAFLFAFACAYSLFDKVQEADFLSHQKYEGPDLQDLYAEKGFGLDVVLISATLFSPLPDIFFEFLPSFFSANIPWVTPFSVLRC
jgi:hypothetical protein